MSRQAHAVAGSPAPAGRLAPAGTLRRGAHLMLVAGWLVPQAFGAADPAPPGTASAGPALAPLLKLQAVPFTQVQIQDGFWAPRRATNRLVSIPHNIDMLEKAGNVKNFELAAAGARTGYSGPVFMDSDLYKGIEAASYLLASDPDPALDRRLDAIIAKIAAAQQPDGYLNTHFQVNAPDQRWTNLRDWHELYCAGHLFEGAVAHYQATGKRNLLNVATKYADYIDSVFGADAGKRMGYPGHPEIELALVKLSQVTGERRYFELARFFIENRGRQFYAQEHGTPLKEYDGAYWQDDVPIRQHQNIKGHAVRAAYLLSGTVDVAARTGDAGLLRMVDRVWRNTTLKRMYLTGGIGPSAHNEGFTTDYDLPNLTAYQETCASVAMILWNHRLNLLYGDARYADVLERALYNGALAGASLDGRKFFYVNPLASRGDHHRSDWFGCACCPPNIARLLSSLGNYLYAVSDRGLWVNHYVQGSVKCALGNPADAGALAAAPIELKVTTDYPWQGRVVLTPKLAAPATFELRLRIPSWCQDALITINGKPEAALRRERGYAVVERLWRSNDTVQLDLDMPVRRILAHPSVKENRGAAAIQRGPIVYCLEACDHTNALDRLALPLEAYLVAEKRPDLLGGVMTLKGQATVDRELEWKQRLYQPAGLPQRVPVTAVPYYAWDNRAPGPMAVWVPVAPPTPPERGLEGQAQVTMSFANDNCQPRGINDGAEIASSSEQPAALAHWWPHKGTDEWVQYTWPKPVEFDRVRVYWFDDTGRGACRLPQSWHVEYLDGTAWKPVAAATTGYEVRPDRWCETAFTPVTTTALRLAVRLQPEWAAGIHEWQVAGPEE